MVHTKDGATAACLLVSHATAKDRKAMVKSIRETIVPMSVDQYGHMVLIVLCAVVDDTKLVSKAILTELKSSCHDLVINKWGRKIVLFLCREDNDPLVGECRERSVNTRYISRINVKLTISKKDKQVRRQELLEFFSEDLISIATANAAEWMRDPLAIQVVQEIILFTRGTTNPNPTLTLGPKSKLVETVVSLVSGDPAEEGHILKLPFTARVYKTLAQGGHFNAKVGRVEGTTPSRASVTIVVDPDLNFASKLKTVIEPYLVSWATGEGSFVVLGLLEALSGKERDELVSHLKKMHKSVSNKSTANKGTRLVLEKIA